MSVQWLERADDPRIADYRDVGDPDLVRRRGLFVAEGRLVVQRIVEEGRHTFRSLLLGEAARRSLEPVLGQLRPEVPIYVCPVDWFAPVTGFNIHRGCLALVERPPDARVGDVLHRARIVVVLEAVANPDNMGGVFRNAAAFGADAVLLSPTCCDPLYRKAIRTSMAATLRVPFARVEDWPEGLSELRARGFTILALTPREPSRPLDAFAAGPADRLALLVGAEGEGLTLQAEAAADCRVRIPVRPEVDSLNLAVAAGIALYRLTGSSGR